MQIATLPRPELIQMADLLAREKNISKKDVLEAMEQGISKAGRSKYGPEYDIRTKIDPATGAIQTARYVTVVETPEDEFTQISLVNAQKTEQEYALLKKKYNVYRNLEEFMKKSIIWIFITFFLLLVIGIILYSLSITGILETKEYEINDKFSDIEIITDTADIEFILSENLNTSVVCAEQKNINHSVRVKDNTLLIKVDDNRKWYEYININFGKNKITIYLPKNEYGELFIDSDTGNINIPNNFNFNSIDIIDDTGNVKNYASVNDNIKIKTSTGNIHIENINANIIDLSASTGNIKMVNAKCVNLLSKVDTGNVLLKNVVATEKFIIETDTGDVKFVASDASDIFVKTDTGNVTGSLLTDKVIFAESDTGNIDVPKVIADEKCEVITDTGDIKITVD